jgi:hypothetical protein
MPLTRLFYRLIVRPFHRESLRTALVVLAVALGVAVVLAIELAGDAAAGSFRSSIESLVGDADLEVAAVGGVPDAVVGTLARLPYPITVHPRVEGYAVAASGQTVPLIGLDLIAERPERLGMAGAAPVQDAQPLADERAVWYAVGQYPYGNRPDGCAVARPKLGDGAASVIGYPNVGSIKCHR